MHIIKLDKRYKGSNNFKYCAIYYYKEAKEYSEARTWCWGTWGPSTELDFYDIYNNKSPWSWYKEYGDVRIYLKTDKELEWFTLRWS